MILATDLHGFTRILQLILHESVEIRVNPWQFLDSVVK
jgi:hypothetical protein